MRPNPRPRTRRVLLSLGFWGLVGLPPGSGDEAPPARMTPAEHLRIRVAEVSEGATSVLDPSSRIWELASPTRILLSRTPRVYQTESPAQPAPPPLELRGLRAGSKVILRLDWSDATRDAPVAPPAKHGEAGDPASLYKRPTAATNTFADAAAVMVPERWSGPSFPSLVMGDRHAPALLYYWNAARGTHLMKASGRATTTRAGTTIPHQARYADRHWTVTLELPDQPDGYPLAFALWDGHAGDRDGMKFFSVWYVLTRSAREMAQGGGQ